MPAPPGRHPSTVPDHDVQLAQIREWLRTGLWFLPLLGAIGAVLLALATVTLDEWLGGDKPSWLAFGRGEDSARLALSVIAGSTLTFTGTVFSITIIALQLASSQFSPRVLRTFLRDRSSQLCLAIFVATFLYALIVLRQVGGSEDVPVPGLAVTGSFLLVLSSIGAFVYFVHHIAQSIRVVSIIESVARETRQSIRENCPAAFTDPGAALEPPPTAPTAYIALDRGPGVLLGIDEDDLVEVARRHECVLVLLPTVGDYLPSGIDVFAVHGSDAVFSPEVLRHLGVGPERTLFQDIPFGFRQLVDIAERALSPAVNDPTTAVQCIDRLHDLLRRLAPRPFPSGRYLDDDGQLRLVVPVVPWEAYVDLAFDEIRMFGAASLQVPRRLRAAVEDLLTVAPPHRMPALERQLNLLDEAIAHHYSTDGERALAARADPQGLR